jgi:hypothetical protein
MILSDHEIQAAIELGLLLIDPKPDLSVFSSTALDLTLDSVVLRRNAPDPSASGPIQELRPASAGSRPTRPERRRIRWRRASLTATQVYSSVRGSVEWRIIIDS